MRFLRRSLGVIVKMIEYPTKIIELYRNQKDPPLSSSANADDRVLDRPTIVNVNKDRC